MHNRRSFAVFIELVCISLLLASLDGTVFAATSTEWAVLSHTSAVASGAQIKVRTIDRKQLLGAFKSADEDGLVLLTAGGEQRLARASVLSISVKTGDRHLRNGLIGFVAGGAAGFGIGVATCHGQPWTGLGCAGKAGVGSIIGVLAGTVTGVALPTGWREVFRSR